MQLCSLVLLSFYLSFLLYRSVTAVFTVTLFKVVDLAFPNVHLRGDRAAAVLLIQDQTTALRYEFVRDLTGTFVNNDGSAGLFLRELDVSHLDNSLRHGSLPEGFYTAPNPPPQMIGILGFSTLSVGSMESLAVDVIQRRVAYDYSFGSHSRSGNNFLFDFMYRLVTGPQPSTTGETMYAVGQLLRWAVFDSAMMLESSSSIRGLVFQNALDNSIAFRWQHPRFAPVTEDDILHFHENTPDGTSGFDNYPDRSERLRPVQLPPNPVPNNLHPNPFGGRSSGDANDPNGENLPPPVPNVANQAPPIAQHP
ncbi:MAG: hypothetical protein M1833_007246 [Piccolia ochrophora]|nr:MAG: hypothetical protein M1833_007246 [Piccolia ochrophora]